MGTNNRNYIIIDAREISLIDFDLFFESGDTLVYNSDQTKTTIKYLGDMPDYTFQYGIEGPYTIYELIAAQDPVEWPDGME